MVMLKLEEQPVLIQAIFNGEIEDVRALLECKPDVNYLDAEKRSPLHAAAYRGDKDLAELLLGQGARVNAKDSRWLTPLHRACGVGADDVVELLLKHKADTTARDRQWQTPLHIAAAHNAVNSIQHLLSHITNINVTDRSGCTALHHAALNGHNEAVELLLSKGSIVNACDKKECRPIHWAAHLGHVDTVNILIQRGADINVKDRNLYTPLHAAVASGMVYVCSLLLTAGTDVNAQNSFGNTPLHIACLNGHHSVCQILLAHHANLEAVNYKGQTALHIAATSTQGVGCLAYLLEQDNIDINRQSADGRTPLHMSAIYGRFTRSKRLIDKGAVVDCADKNGNTALHIAAQFGHDILTSTLLDFGADPVKRAYEGRTPLHVCCLSGFVEVCRKFLQCATVDLNIVDDHGRTPIHCAAYKGSVECLDLLVSKGGNFKLQDSIGRAALHYASVRGHYNCVYTLVGIGSDVNVLDAEGCSALHLAAAYDTEGKCVEYLLQHKADPLLKDIKGFTPVHYAVNGSNRIAMELLLKVIGKNVNFLDAGMPETTPLHLASRHGDLNILRSVIQYFPETNIKTREGYTPLLIAAREGHTPNVQMLLRYGAKVAVCDDVAGMSPVHHSAKNGHLHCLALLVDNAEVKSVIDKRDHYQRTALMLAISGAHQDCALTLLKSNADPNVVDADLHSPLFRAVVTDQNNVVQLLIGRGSRVTAPDCNGKTVLHLAAACGHLKCLQKIMMSVEESEALVLDKNGFSALHWACYYGNASCLEFLLQRNIFTRLEGNPFTPVHCAAFTGSERCLELLHTKFGVECLRAKDTRNRTPLHLAAWHGHADCVRFLLDNGGEVEAKDEIGRSPLISAAQNGQSQVIDLLLAHKADLKSSDANGSTALHVACLRKHNHTALLLLEYIADVDVINMIDNDKKTALHLSARNGLVEVTAELIKKGASVVATDSNGLTPALYCAPNACVAQCLAIILAHHPAEMPVGGLHTKECMKNVLRKLSRTSHRSSSTMQSSQTELSLLRNPHELFLVDVSNLNNVNVNMNMSVNKHRRRRHSHSVLTTPSCTSISNTQVARVIQPPLRSRREKLQSQKNLILIENYDREEFDVSTLKRQKGLSLHRSYSEMALVSTHDKLQPTKPTLKYNSIWDDETIDDAINTQAHTVVPAAASNTQDEREVTYQKLIDGYKTIALKMACVSNRYDVSMDDIQKVYVEQYAQKRKARREHSYQSHSCPVLSPQLSLKNGPRQVEEEEQEQQEEEQDEEEDEEEEREEQEEQDEQEQVEVELEEEQRNISQLEMEMELEAQQIEANYESSQCGHSDENDPDLEHDQDEDEDHDTITVDQQDEGVEVLDSLEYVTCGLPPYSPSAPGTPAPSLSFAAFTKVEATVTTGTDAEISSSTSSDALSHGDFLYENFCGSEATKSYCDCQYVCKHCVLLNRYDYELDGDGADLLQGGLRFTYTKECLLTSEERRFPFYRNPRHCRVNDSIDEDPADDGTDLIPMENLVVTQPRVLVGEGAIRKTRVGEEEYERRDRGCDAPEGAPPEKLNKAKVSKEHQKFLKDRCEAEKARRKGEHKSIESDGGLDLGLEFNFAPEDFQDPDAEWPKVTFDEGCIRFPEELDTQVQTQEADQAESPTRDLDWSLFADDLDVESPVKVKASESLTNVACGSPPWEVATSTTTSTSSGGPPIEFLDVATSATALISVVSSGSCTQPVKSSTRSKRASNCRDAGVNKDLHQRQDGGVAEEKVEKLEHVELSTVFAAPAPPGGITSLASSFIAPRSCSCTCTCNTQNKLKLHKTAFNINEIPSSLLATSASHSLGHPVGACLNFKQQNTTTTLLRDSAAIIDISALFAKSANRSKSPIKGQQRRRDDKPCNPCSTCASIAHKQERDQEAELLSVMQHAQKIQRFSYEEMMDLSEGLNMSAEAKAMARRLIEQLAKKQKTPQAQEQVKQNIQHGSQENVQVSIKSTTSDSGSDSGCESLTTSSVESVSSADIEVRTIKKPKRNKKQDDNKCHVQ